VLERSFTVSVFTHLKILVGNILLVNKISDKLSDREKVPVARCIYFASFYDFLLDFGTVVTVWYFGFVFFISLSNMHTKCKYSFLVIHVVLWQYGLV
jgi:hypothetical protein